MPAKGPSSRVISGKKHTKFSVVSILLLSPSQKLCAFLPE